MHRLCLFEISGIYIILFRASNKTLPPAQRETASTHGPFLFGPVGYPMIKFAALSRTSRSVAPSSIGEFPLGAFSR